MKGFDGPHPWTRGDGLLYLRAKASGVEIAFMIIAVGGEGRGELLCSYYHVLQMFSVFMLEKLVTMY